MDEEKQSDKIGSRYRDLAKQPDPLLCGLFLPVAPSLAGGHSDGLCRMWGFRHSRYVLSNSKAGEQGSHIVLKRQKQGQNGGEDRTADLVG